MKLTKIQRCALLHVRDQDVFPGGSYGHGNTMNSLRDLGILQRMPSGEWFITQRGRELLAATESKR